jgi:predicted AAA+ superfamily ATPase
MWRRNLISTVRAALQDTPAVLLIGARQTGKSTLVDLVRAEGLIDRAITCDDLGILSAAAADPQGFIAGLQGRVAIDEIQRAPDLLLPIKAAIDRDRQPGRFLLTGSANVLTLPRVADTLAGRMEVLTLRPLSCGELLDRRETFLERAFAAGDPGWASTPLDRAAVLERVLAGGFPELQARSRERRAAWYASYLTTLLTRDVRDFSGIEAVADLPRLLTALAARTANLVNVADLGRELGLPATTLRRYLAVLEAAFLVQFLPAWSVNIGKRLVRAPKVMPADTGLAAHLLGLSELIPGAPHAGALVEAFVAGELQKQCGWSPLRPALAHFRTHAGEEVDVVLETATGVVGVEVKMAGAVSSQDLRGLRLLEQAAGPRFRRGVVFYLGDTVVPFGPNLHAVPMSELWAG